MIRISCDVHTHTLASRHAYSTIDENVRAAAEQNFEVLGSTDHFSGMLYPERDVRNLQFFFNVKSWPREWHGVTLLHGCEADIVDGDGHLFGYDIPVDREINGAPLKHPTTLKKRVFRDCDYVIASIHRKDFTLGQTPAQNAQMYVNALQDPKVLILGHLGRSGVDFELDPVLEAARDLGKLIELNEASLSDSWKRDKLLAPCRHIAERCAELGVQVSFGSDSHISCGIARYENVRKLLEDIDFPDELVACRSKEAFLAAARAALPDFAL